MKTIHYTNTLEYYDGPIVFEARDDIGGNYIAVAVKLENEQEAFLVRGVNPSKAAEFRTGELDLRSLILDLEKEPWYLTTPDPDIGDSMSLELQDSPIQESEFLPNEGFLLYDGPSDNFLVKEARIRHNFVVEVTTELLNDVEHEIRSDIFRQLIQHTDNLVKHAYKIAVRDISSEKFSTQNPHMMDVVIPAAGSFRFVLEASEPSNALGHNKLSLAWKQIGELFQVVMNFNGDTAVLQKYRGHLAGSCLTLLKLLEENNIGVGYAWVGQNSSKPKSFKVSASEVKPIVEALSKVDDIDVEKVTLTGELDKVTRDSGAWGLHTESGKVVGKIKEDASILKDLVVGQEYRFHCVDEITHLVAGKEIHTLYLEQHEPTK